MTERKEAVGSSEFVLRRVHKNHCSTTSPRQVLRVGFCPNPADVTVISVYREKETSVAAVLAAAGKPNECYVVRVPVQALIDMGFTLGREDDPGSAPGHFVIPELRRSEYESKKNALKDKQEQLARIASNYIVHSPPGG
jgi:hypothetical protein